MLSHPPIMTLLAQGTGGVRRGAPDFFVDHMLDGWAAPHHTIETNIRTAYRQQFHDPERVATICQQYRAAATVDCADDEADRDHYRRVQAPVQVLWSQQGAVDAWYDPIAIWKRWATNVKGRSLLCGHFLPEEQPDLTAQLLRTLLMNSLGLVPEGEVNRPDKPVAAGGTEPRLPKIPNT